MKQILPIICIGVGGLIAAHGFQQSKPLRDAKVDNFLELKGSPYGEILAAALQDPVHLLSHGGIGHEHVKSENGDVCTTCGVDHEAAEVEYLKDKPLLTQAKLRMLSMEADVRQNHMPGPRSSDVKQYENIKMRQLMREAYDLDPTNYGCFNVVSSDEMLSSGLAAMEKIAQKSLAATEGRNWDPEDALTAASAAENLLIYRAKEFGFDEKQERLKDYTLFLAKVQNYERVFNRAVEDKRIYSFKQEKIDEMLERYGYFSYTLREYGKKLGYEPSVQP